MQNDKQFSALPAVKTKSAPSSPSEVKSLTTRSELQQGANETVSRVTGERRSLSPVRSRSPEKLVKIFRGNSIVEVINNGSINKENWHLFELDNNDIVWVRTEDVPAFDTYYSAQQNIVVEQAEHIQNTSISYTKEKCIEIGNKAIEYARKAIPFSANQTVDVEADKSLLARRRAAATQELTKLFRSKAVEFADEELKDDIGEIISSGFLKLHPIIRAKIAEKTRGGLCGDYASVVYAYLTREHPKLTATYVKSERFGDHAWVQIETADGETLSVDAWPAAKQDRKTVDSSIHIPVTLSKIKDDKIHFDMQKDFLSKLEAEVEKFLKSQEAMDCLIKILYGKGEQLKSDYIDGSVFN